jgi:hypothetical protein
MNRSPGSSHKDRPALPTESHKPFLQNGKGRGLEGSRNRAPPPTLPAFHTDFLFDRSLFDRSLLRSIFTSTDAYFDQSFFRPVLLRPNFRETITRARSEVNGVCSLTQCRSLHTELPLSIAANHLFFN